MSKELRELAEEHAEKFNGIEKKYGTIEITPDGLYKLMASFCFEQNTELKKEVERLNKVNKGIKEDFNDCMKSRH